MIMEILILSCFNPYTTRNRLKEHKEICNKHDICRMQMPKLVERLLKCDHGEKHQKLHLQFILI